MTELLARVRDRSLAAFANQDVPFERLVEELAPARSMARHPLFQAILTLQNTARASLRLSAVRAEGLGAGLSAAKFDLDVNVNEIVDEDGRPAGLAGAVTAAADLFEPRTVERLVARYLRVLTAMTDRPAARLSSVTITGDDDGREPHVLPVGRTVPQMIEEQAAGTPDAVAVIVDGVETTYGRLDRRANQLARHLVEQGVRPGAVVGLSLPRGLDLVTAMLAVWKAGGAYLPIDPESSGALATEMLADAGGICAIAGVAYEYAQVPVLVLTDLALDGYADGPLGLAIDGELPACLAYPGSTGVVVTHTAVANRVAAFEERHGLRPDDRVLHQAAIDSDTLIAEIGWPLASGAAVVIGGADVTTALFTPRLLAAFLREWSAADCAGLRRVIVHGEPLPAEIEAEFFAALPGVELHTVHGTAMTTGEVAAWRCDGVARSAGVPFPTRCQHSDLRSSLPPTGAGGRSRRAVRRRRTARPRLRQPTGPGRGTVRRRPVSVQAQGCSGRATV
nr:AMP-binding protein [Kutzneria sp. 744]